jgi:hypothetical protein
MDIRESIKLLATSLVVASTVLGIGTSILYRLRSRVKNSLWPFAALIAIAIVLGVLATQPGPYHRSAPIGSLDFGGLFAVLSAVWLIFDWVVDIRGCVGNGDLEFSFPREWGRQQTWIGAAVSFMGATTTVSCAGIQIWVGVPTGFMVAVWGYMTAKFGGKIEFRTRGIQLGSKFHSWTTLGKFEWYSENEMPILRIRARSGDIRIHWPEDSSVESVLLKHGLARG